jgi:hypothetical protein
MKPVYVYLLIAGTLVGAIQLRELAMVAYVPVRAFAITAIELIDANSDRDIPGMQGVGDE